MQVTCPNCGARVTASHINIHNMTAVCAACDTVFPFKLPVDKIKRRKAKQPANLAIRDDDTFEIDFRTNFRLDKNETVIATVLGGLSFLLVGLLLVGSGKAPIILTGAFMAVAFTLFYLTTLMIANKTHIKMDEDTISITRRPLPNPLVAGREVSLAGVTAIKYEETAVSKKEAYDTPRYVVWAETEDGSRRIIINDALEEYAVFVAQRLDERLQAELDPDTSRLEDSAYDDLTDDDETDLNETVGVGQKGRGG